MQPRPRDERHRAHRQIGREFARKCGSAHPRNAGQTRHTVRRCRLVEHHRYCLAEAWIAQRAQQRRAVPAAREVSAQQLDKAHLHQCSRQRSRSKAGCPDLVENLRVAQPDDLQVTEILNDRPVDRVEQPERSGDTGHDQSACDPQVARSSLSRIEFEQAAGGKRTMIARLQIDSLLAVSSNYLRQAGRNQHNAARWTQNWRLPRNAQVHRAGQDVMHLDRRTAHDQTTPA